MATFAAHQGGCTSNPTDGLPRHPNFVVFLADSLRADHLPCYGHSLQTAPVISAFSEDNLCFERCHAVATWTKPATASILTGVHPLLHRTIVSEWAEEGVLRDHQFQVLPPDITTTAETLSRVGYDTAFFQANPNARDKLGFSRGCNHYHFRINESPDDHMDAVLSWLDTEAREPFYAYIHLIDPHEPYAADSDIIANLIGTSLEDRLSTLPMADADLLRGYHERTWKEIFNRDQRLDTKMLLGLSDAGVQYFSTLYDAEIVKVDQQFERLQRLLQQKGWADRTAVFVTSDHGEAFGEDHQFYHGSFIHDAQTHIPLILKIPGAPSSARIPWTTSQLDIHQTIAHLAGCPSGRWATGYPLADRSGTPLPTFDRPVLTVLDLHRSDPSKWEVGIALGDVRVKASNHPYIVNAHRIDQAEEVAQIKITETAALDDDRIRIATEHFFVDRHNFNKTAENIPQPEWEASEDSNDEMLEALGYL